MKTRVYSRVSSSARLLRAKCSHQHARAAHKHDADIMLLRANKVYMIIILIEHYWRHRLPEVTHLVMVKGAVCKILVEKHLKKTNYNHQQSVDIITVLRF